MNKKIISNNLGNLMMDILYLENNNMSQMRLNNEEIEMVTLQKTKIKNIVIILKKYIKIYN